MDNRVFLTKEQALKALPEKDEIHCFVSTTFGLFGADWSKEQVEEYIKEAKTLEIGGRMCRGMKHGLVVNGSDGIKFFEALDDVLDKYEMEQND